MHSQTATVKERLWFIRPSVLPETWLFVTVRHLIAQLKLAAVETGVIGSELFGDIQLPIIGTASHEAKSTALGKIFFWKRRGFFTPGWYYFSSR